MKEKGALDGMTVGVGGSIHELGTGGGQCLTACNLELEAALKQYL